TRRSSDLRSRPRLRRARAGRSRADPVSPGRARRRPRQHRRARRGRPPARQATRPALVCGPPRRRPPPPRRPPLRLAGLAPARPVRPARPHAHSRGRLSGTVKRAISAKGDLAIPSMNGALRGSKVTLAASPSRAVPKRSNHGVKQKRSFHLSTTGSPESPRDDHLPAILPLNEEDAVADLAGGHRVEQEPPVQC